MAQAKHILAILDAARRDLLVQWLPSGCRVETEQTDGIEGYACDGCNLSDALAQVAQVLALELGLDPNAVEGAAWTHDAEDDVDAPAPWAVEPLVEFCASVFPCIRAGCGLPAEERDCFCAEHSREFAKVAVGLGAVNE